MTKDDESWLEMMTEDNEEINNLKEEIDNLTDMLCRLMKLLDQCEKEESTPWGYGYDKDIQEWWKAHCEFDKERK